MINSMTGYGCAEGQDEGITYFVEIRAVNNRFFKARIKLPESIAFLEDEIEKFLRQKIHRGTITYSLGLRNAPAEVLFEIDETALRAYVEQLGRIAKAGGVESRLDIAPLLQLPGIVQPAIPDSEQARKVKEIVLKLTREAVDQLRQMRSAEGAALASDLEVNCRAITEDLEKIKARSAATAGEYHDKLSKKINSLLSDAKVQIDEATLAREVAVFAERADVSEEISRLASHLQQFDESCQQDGRSGRRLDFLSQEMLREANTIASKACDTEIIHRVVDIKCRIDRIKEQVQNVE